MNQLTKILAKGGYLKDTEQAVREWACGVVDGIPLEKFTLTEILERLRGEKNVRR